MTQSQNLSLQDKLKIISTDFLDRDGTTFTYERKDGRLDWEKLIGDGGAYSEYILHPKSTEELITNAYKIATDMITVMDTPYKVKINITGNKSCTDSKNLYVATKVFDDSVLTVGQKLDAFIGFTVHEGCHLLYTNFVSQTKDSLIRTLANIIEDERIERNCGEAKPGLVNFLKASKYYAFDRYYSEMSAKGAFDNLDTFKRLLNAILSYVRYPKTLDQKDTEEFIDVLLQVKNILTPYPASHNEVMSASKKIADIIRDFLKNQSKKDNNTKQDSGGDKGKSDKSDNQNESSANNDNQEEQEQSSSSSQPQQEKQDEQEEQDDDGEQETVQSGTQDCQEQKSDEDVEKEIEAGMAEMESALEQLASGPNSGLSADDISSTVMEDGGKVGQVCSGDLERGKMKNSYIHKGIANQPVYNNALSNVRRYIPAISKILKMSSTEYKLSLRGMRSGVLDTNKLAEAYQGVPTVYLREGEVKTDKVNVCILIDESGSMWGTGEAKARETAVLLNEALNKLNNVDLYIYGHTASRKNTELFVYRERGFNVKYALGSTESRAGNHDSVAIREAAARVRKHTKDKCLFFMISDGAPNESPDMVRKAVRDVEKDNFSVVAISIDPYYNPSLMYSKNVTLSDMSSLALEIGKLVKKAVMENTKKKINL